MIESHREELIEKYEDAMFALVMNDLMQADGVHWETENERLKQDDSSQVPTTMRETVFCAINHVFSKQTRRNNLRTARRIVVRVAVIFLIVFIALAVPFCTASAFRRGVLDLLIEKFEKETYVRVEPIAEAEAEFGLPWLPGLDWQKTYSLDKPDLRPVHYERETGEFIEYCELPKDVFNKTLDTEDAKMQREFVGEKEVFFTY
ncbi:MAG: hypothetical protein IJH47_00275 [Oscillospiraceae bacterium]|nr:hypothetical protein [Oscillospiraceae bacterium]